MGFWGHTYYCFANKWFLPLNQRVIVLIRQALRCPNNMQMVRAIFQERPEFLGLDPRGPRRIYAGTKQILFSVLCFIVVMIEFAVTGNAICSYRG